MKLNHYLNGSTKNFIYVSLHYPESLPETTIFQSNHPAYYTEIKNKKIIHLLFIIWLPQSSTPPASPGTT